MYLVSHLCKTKVYIYSTHRAAIFRRKKLCASLFGENNFNRNRARVSIQSSPHFLISIRQLGAPQRHRCIYTCI